MDEAAALLRLLRPYSPTGHEAGAVAAFVRLASELGYSTKVDGVGNGIARRGRGRPHLVFLGHIDTVPGPRPVRRSRGRVYGRGAVDAKGPLVAALIAGASGTPAGTLEVIAAVGEEADSPGARHLLRRRDVDAVIAGEPSRWDGITVGYRGELRLVARFSGRRTHYSSPTPTTADVAVDWLSAVRTWVAGQRVESPFRSLSVKLVRCRTTGAGDREGAELEIDLRLPPGVTAAGALRALPRGPGRPTFRPTVRVDPIETARSDPVVRALEAGVRAAGGTPTLWRKGGTSDWNLVGPAWRVPGAAYGPGDPHLDHTASESVSEAELARAVLALRTAFGRLAADPSLTLRRSDGGGG
jgi:[amino group carrier protein]-lysine/ornithine hydrolase